VGAGERIAAEDAEPEADANRLELLAVVRGLEALDGPARVTLLCGSRYVRRGVQNDLAQWRDSGWRWECFGKLVPIRDLDLWQRVDRALAIHQVECYFGLRISDCGTEESAAPPKPAIRTIQADNCDTVPALSGAALSRSA
jgi:ribonuclease HI